MHHYFLLCIQVFENCEVLESDKFQVSWHRDISRDVVCFQLRGRVDPQEYMAFGISGLTTSTLMPVSDVTVGWIDGLTGQPMVVDYYVQEYTSVSCDSDSLQYYHIVTVISLAIIHRSVVLLNMPYVFGVCLSYF